MPDLTDDVVEAAIEEMANRLFERYPTLENFYWTQYVDNYGNFLLNTDNFVINEFSFSCPDAEEVEDELFNFFDLIDPDILREIYGENCKVKFTREGLELLPYDYLDEDGL